MVLVLHHRNFALLAAELLAYQVAILEWGGVKALETVAGSGGEGGVDGVDGLRAGGVRENVDAMLYIVKSQHVLFELFFGLATSDVTAVLVGHGLWMGE